MANKDKISPEPGEVTDLELGLPGGATPYPGDEPDEPTQINDDEEDEE